MRFCTERLLQSEAQEFFLESIFTKIHQAQGNMKLPMIAQIAGAATNTVLDPILIFGFGIVPELGIASA